MPSSPTRLLLPAAALAVGAAVAGLAVRPSPEPLRLRERVVSPLFEPGLAPALLETPERDRWQQPERIVRALGLRPGDTVADIGAGSGYLLPHLSRAVGPTGTVLAEEIQPEFIPSLERQARRLGNVRVLLGSAEDPGLPPASVDCLVLLTVYHEVRSPVPFLRALRRAARPGARLAIIDFDAARGGDPPAPAGHELPASDVLAEALAAGWHQETRHEFLSSQFFLVFRSPRH